MAGAQGFNYAASAGRQGVPVRCTQVNTQDSAPQCSNYVYVQARTTEQGVANKRDSIFLFFSRWDFRVQSSSRKRKMNKNQTDAVKCYSCADKNRTRQGTLGFFRSTFLKKSRKQMAGKKREGEERKSTPHLTRMQNYRPGEGEDREHEVGGEGDGVKDQSSDLCVGGYRNSLLPASARTNSGRIAGRRAGRRGWDRGEAREPRKFCDIQGKEFPQRGVET